MLIAHTEVGANPDALPSGQSNGTRFQYVIVQADGLGELDAGISPYGDDGDPWPGSTGATRFNFETNPRATWYTLNAWTGIDVLDVIPDGSGSVQLQINWVPTLIPSLRFINPPGGASVNSIYQVNFDATDVFGGTTIQVYYTQDPTDITIQPNQANLVGSLRKTTPGTRRLSVNWDVRNIPDSRYFLFAKLVPGPGADGSELEHTEPRGGRNNQGDGGVDVSQVGIASNKARSETWALVCIDPQGEEWLVNSSLSQPVPADTDPDQDPYPHASTCPESAQPFCNGYAYTSVGGEVTFTIEEGDTPFTIGDTFSFTTTGITATSRAVSVTGGRISESPTAAIFATPLAGPPPLRVSFDGRDSTDPDGQALQFQWTFGDGSQPATGARVEHTYTRSGTFTAILRATNPLNGRFGEASVDIEVTNNSPKARISAEPTSGPAPLTVNFSGSQSSDTETDPEDLIYQWEFGDGGTANSAGQPGVSISTEHFYTRRAGGSLCTAQDPCTFVAALTVTDEGGKQDTDTVTIHVGNTAPVASVSFTRLQGTPPHEVTFNAINSTDAEGHDLTVTWSWGDPKPDETYPVEGPAGDGFVPHVYDLPQGVTSASYHTSATITDELGASTEWPGVTVLVSEQLAGTSDPVAAFTIDPDPPLLNEEFKVDAGLSFDRPSGGLPSKFIWHWDDQTTTSVKADGTVPDACRAVAPQDSCVTATHTYTQSGQYRITLTVCDDETPANCGTRTRTVRVEREDTGIDPSTNRRPTAVITVTPTEGIAGQTEFTFDGRNSVDPDDDALTYSWNFGDGSPRDSRPEAPHVYSDPGTYTVTLTVTDTSNASHDARMTITVRSIEGNRDPLAFIGTGPRTGTVPLTLTFNGENSFDPDGDPLTFRWEFYLGETLNGTATGPAVTYTFSQEGVYSVILEVSDGRGGVTPSGAEIVQVTARVPGPGNDNDNGGDEEPGRDIPDSADQRNGGFCGLGMLTSFFGSLLGLSVMRLTRRRLGA
jgi:PKD repeat protein